MLHRFKLLGLLVILPILVLILHGGTIAIAQTTTDGAIDGTVYDAQSAVVPGATITIRNEGTNAESVDKTDAQGYFKIIHLAPASYMVTITANGFQTYQAEHTIVVVGQSTTMQPHLTIGSASQTVTVSGEVPLINMTSNDFSSNINPEQIDNLPVNGGRWSSFAILTPGVVSNSSGFGLLSFRGTSELLNNNTIDGADNNQAYFSEERGRTRLQYSTSEVAVQEFQVNTSNYSAEYGRSAGGVINTVTKSGTNSFHGQAFFRDRDNEWGAANHYTTLAVLDPATGKYVNEVYVPKDWRKQWGLGVGGPIFKDKLFFFFAYDQSKRNFPGTARSNNPTNFFATPDPTSTCAAATGTTKDVCLMKTDLKYATYGDALAAYNTAFNGLVDGVFGTVPRTGDQMIFFPKLDWQITPKHRASFEYNRVRWNSPAGVQTQSSNTYGKASFGNDYVKEDWGIAKLVSTFTSSILNEVRFQYGRDFEYQSSQAPTAYEEPLANNGYGRPPFTCISANVSGTGCSLTNGIQIGKAQFLERAAYPDERRTQIADTVSWLHGNHSLKFGVDYNRVLDYINNLYNGNGAYIYNNTGDYFSDYLNLTTGVGPANYQSHYNGFIQAFGPVAFQIISNDYAFFAEDDWKITPRLTLNLGLRYEYESLPSSILPNTNDTSVVARAGNATVAELTSQSPNDKNNWGPRFGFAWDAFGTGTTVVRGGYGIYYGRIINSDLLQTYVASGNPEGVLTYSGITPKTNLTPNAPTPTYLTFPNILPAAPAIKGAALSIAYFDKNFQAPQIQQIDFAIEQNLGRNTVFSLSYVGSLGRELINGIDQNYDAESVSSITYTVIGQTAGPNKGAQAGPYVPGTKITVPLYTNKNRPNTNYAAIVDVVSNANSNYNGMIAQLNHRSSGSLQYNINYTWAKAMDFNQYVGTGSPSNNVLNPANLRDDYGISANDVRERFTANAVYSPTFEGTGFKKRLVNGWTFAPIFQAQTGLPVTGTVGGATLGGFSGPLGTGVNRLPGLRNTYNYPRTFVLDGRVSKAIAITERMNVELFGELFNALNHVNITGLSTALYNIGGTASAATLTFQNTFGQFNNGNSNFVYNPRQVQIGARFNF
jgi:outer membrane receptor protein involved in Fe transport